MPRSSGRITPHYTRRDAHSTPDASLKAPLKMAPSQDRFFCGHRLWNYSNQESHCDMIWKCSTRYSPPLLLLLLRTTYSAATGSTQPLKMSAQAGGRKRARTDLEREGAPAEADAATASTEQEERDAEFEEVEAYLAAVRAEEREAELEALEAELAAARADTKKKQSIVCGLRGGEPGPDRRSARAHEGRDAQPATCCRQDIGADPLGTTTESDSRSFGAPRFG